MENAICVIFTSCLSKFIYDTSSLTRYSHLTFAIFKEPEPNWESWVPVKKLPLSMAALSSFLSVARRFSTVTNVDSSSFSQRIRDLPKDLPGTNIRREVSHVLIFLPLSFVDYFSNHSVCWEGNCGNQNRKSRRFKFLRFVALRIFLGLGLGSFSFSFFIQFSAVYFT